MQMQPHEVTFSYEHVRELASSSYVCFRMLTYADTYADTYAYVSYLLLRARARELAMKQRPVLC
jgi:hypothetical protein